MASDLSSGPSSRPLVGPQAWRGLRPAQKPGELRRGRAPSVLRAFRPEVLTAPHFKSGLFTEVAARLGVKGGAEGGRDRAGSPAGRAGKPGPEGVPGSAGSRRSLSTPPAAPAPEPAGTAQCLRPQRTAHLTLNAAPPTPILLGLPGRGLSAIGRGDPRRPRPFPRPRPRPPVLWTAAWRPSSPPGPRPLEQMLPSCGRGADARARALLAGASSRWARESERRKRKGGGGRGVGEGREEEEEEVGARSRLASRPRGGRGRGARARTLAFSLAPSIHPPVAAHARALRARAAPPARERRAGVGGGGRGARTARGLRAGGVR